METRTIKIERETFERNGKTYFGYFVGGEVRGRAVKAGVRPPDNGGYAVLDILFDGAMETDLTVTPFELTTEDGRVITGNTYAVTSVDPETGVAYSCKVKPARESDKTLLQMLLGG